jgi:hypothetical protein
MIVISAILFVIPFASLALLFFFKQKVFEDDDPTVLEKLSKDEIERREKIIRARKAKVTQSMRSFKNLQEDDPFQVDSSEKEELVFEDIEISKIERFAEDEVELEVWTMDTIAQSSRLIEPEGGKEAKGKCIVDKRLLASRVNEMYKMVDLVIDGATFEFLLNVLNKVAFVAAIAFGWFLGVQLAEDWRSRPDANLMCG